MISRKTIAIFIIILSFFSCNRKTETISPKIKNITESVYASGMILSQNQYEVYPKENGIVNNISIKEGDYVKIGQLLFTLESPNAKIAADNAKLNAIINDYDANREKLTEANNSIQLAIKNLNNDSILFERQKNLWNQNVGTKIELEQRALKYEKSKVELKQAQIYYNDLKRKLALASQQSKNNLKIAQTLEKDLEIRSTLEGLVYKIDIKKGEMASPTVPLAVIGGKIFLIELNIDELDIVKVKKGQKVFIRMSSYKSQIFGALITDIFPMMNERTRTFKVQAAFMQKPEVLYPNLTLEANIMINEKQKVLTIPTRFLLSDSTVMLEDETVQKIKSGLSDYNLTEIKSGLNINSKIIIPK